MKPDKVLILDFGSQYAQLIARRVREQRVYSELVSWGISPDEIRAHQPKGLILSGGPASVLDQNAPFPHRAIFDLDIPILGICYGMQVTAQMLGGRVEHGLRREYGPASVKVVGRDLLFRKLPRSLNVWMSHGDRVSILPEGFKETAVSTHGVTAAMSSPDGRLLGLQFHPEVVHTPKGKEIIANFLFNVCGCTPNWAPKSIIDDAVKNIRTQVGDGRVICGVSGGVDSAVTAVLCQRAVHDALDCILVDNGLMREGEKEEAASALMGLGVKLHVIDASDKFISALKGIVNPEGKRRRVGTVFVEVFEQEARRLGVYEFLAQGTLYPDVIESVRPYKGPSATIKSHHNVGGLPEKLGFKLVEPLRFLFKDEVRQIGRALGLPDAIIRRQPFPGPGLAVRILDEVTPQRLQILRHADRIVRKEIADAKLSFEVWQGFAVLLPVHTVGVMGDERTYENAVVLRAVTSEDGMTADWAKLPYDLLARISSRIVNEVRGINRVVYDVTSKPPGTIEWE